MILSLFWALFLISLALIIISIVYSKQWGGFGIVGFTFLFLISFVMLQGNLEVETGANVTSNYGYDVNGSVTSTNQVITYSYESWDDSNSHTIGYFLAIVSFIGFAASFLNIRVNWREKQ